MASRAGYGSLLQRQRGQFRSTASRVVNSPAAMAENIFVGLRNRILQRLAMIIPGAQTTRVRLHRMRGVNIGQQVWIGYEALIETSYPFLVHIGDRSIIGIRSTIIAH